MIDFLIVASLTLACVIVIRRVRRLGFAGLRPDFGGAIPFASRSVLVPMEGEAVADGERLVSLTAAQAPTRPDVAAFAIEAPARGSALPLPTAAHPAIRRPGFLVRRPALSPRATAAVGAVIAIVVAGLAVWQAGAGSSSHKLDDVTITSSRELAPPGAVKQPRGIAVSADGTLFVADADSKSVLAIPLEGGEPRSLASGELGEPSAVALAPDHTLLVLDGENGALWQVDPDSGTAIERIAPDVGLYGPRGLAVAPDGRIAVADTGDSRVVVFPRGGGQPEIFKNLREPTDVAFLPDGNLLVAATGEQRLVALKPNGERARSWEMPIAFTVVGPHLAILPDGSAIATTPEDGSLLHITADGQAYQRVSLGPAHRKPVGIAVTAAGIAVADSESGGVTLFPSPPPMRP